METPWHYLDNQFLNGTKENYKKAFQLSQYHNAFLQARVYDDPLNPDWTLMFNRYNPFHQDYADAYTAWQSAGGLQQGKTVDIDEMLNMLPAEVDTWDSMIKSIPGFRKGSGNHQALFPFGRRPFNTGSKDARIEAVRTLAESMNDYPPLSAVTALVNTFHGQLLTVRNTQTGAIGTTKFKSQAVELGRVEVMTQQYRNLGYLIDKFSAHPELIAPFFDLNVLRQSDQTRYTGTLTPNEMETVAIHTFMADDQIKVFIDSSETVPSGTLVHLYLATIPLGMDSAPVMVEADAAPVTFGVNAFAITDLAAHRYLTAKNTNAMNLDYVVDLL